MKKQLHNIGISLKYEKIKYKNYLYYLALLLKFWFWFSILYDYNNIIAYFHTEKNKCYTIYVKLIC